MHQRSLYVCLLTLAVACTYPKRDVAPGVSPAGAANGVPGSTPLPVIDLDFFRTHLAQWSKGLPENTTLSPDGKSAFFLRSGPQGGPRALYEMDVASRRVRLLLEAEMLTADGETTTALEQARRERMRLSGSGVMGFTLAQDGKKILVPHSGGIFVYTRDSGRVQKLKIGPSEAIDAKLSPNGERVAYVRNHNLYTMSVGGGEEIAITRGGTELRSFGTSDFMAQEELGRFSGYWWSPDSKSLLYQETDTRDVERLLFADPAHPERLTSPIAYPRVGKALAKVRFGMAPAQGGKTQWVEWKHAEFPYVGRVDWSSDAGPVLFMLNRTAQVGALMRVNSKTGALTRLLVEEDAAWLYEDLSLPYFLPNGEGFLWSSERSGEWQLELRGPSGTFIRNITARDARYRQFLRFDPVQRSIYFTGGADPSESAIYVVPLDGGSASLVLGAKGELVTARSSGGHFVTRETSLVAPRASRIRDTKGAVIAELPSVAVPLPFLPKVEIVKIGENQVNVSIVRPRTFSRDKRYPILEVAYAGPIVNMVRASAEGHMEAQWYADAIDAIVVQMDTAGTPGRGRDWARAAYGKLFALPVRDHADTLAALAKQYPEMDGARVGVMGWSAGGMFAARAVLERSDVYRAAAAGAPAADLRDGDAGLEWFMGAPDARAGAYEAESLLPLASKPYTTQGALLLIQGTADDNVPLVHVLKLIDALEQAGRPFEFWPLAGTTHMPVDPAQRVATARRVATFFREHLRGEKH